MRLPQNLFITKNSRVFLKICTNLVTSLITGCFRGMSRDKLYSDLGLKSLSGRRFYRKLIAFYKTVNKKGPQYLIDYLPTQYLASINLRKRPAIYPLDARAERYRNSFFPYCISQ